jgi:hypothetical protein
MVSRQRKVFSKKSGTVEAKAPPRTEVLRNSLRVWSGCSLGFFMAWWGWEDGEERKMENWTELSL